MSAVEVNFDGLPGPTHNFGGLGIGNLASAGSAGSRSWPRRAALQSLAKMRAMTEMGLVQGVFPPHPRPATDFARRMGYRGGNRAIIERLASDSPALLAAIYSSSPMWAANAATVSAAPDTRDGRIHLTAANLSSQLHRAAEASHTERLLRALFNDRRTFAHHRPLPGALADEGAANHTRLARDYGRAGVSLFVFGRQLLGRDRTRTTLPARQVLEASESVARLHGLDPRRAFFARQLPEAIDAGVFHNDVICVGNRNLLLIHEQALVEQQAVLDRLDAAMDGNLRVILVPAARISLGTAVSTYLFNSQLVSPTDDPEDQVLIAPLECRDDEAVHGFLQELLKAGALSDVRFFDVRQSMKNGGGPACLRLRVPMDESALARVSGKAIASRGAA